jgi:hypothetical protein
METPHKNWLNTTKYKWQKSVVLTPAEGIAMEQICAQHDCDNISQLCKKIVRGELVLCKRDGETSDPENVAVLQARIAQYERILTEIKELLP